MQLFKKAGIVLFSILLGSIFLALLHLAWAEKPSNVSDAKDKAMAIALSEGRDGSATKFRKKEELIITEEKEEPAQLIDTYVRHMPSRKVDAQPGKVKITDTDFEYNYAFKAFGKLPVEFSLNHEYVSIDNTTAVKLPAHLVGMSMGLETTLPFFNFDKTYLRMDVNPSFFSDDWVFHTSSFRIPSDVYIIYQPSQKWTFVYGVAAYPDYENPVLPILGFIYKPNDKLSFNIVPKRPNISYILNDKLTVYAEGGSSFNDEFEVKKDGLSNVVLRYRESHLGAGIKYKCNKFIESSLSVGGVFNRYLQYRDSLGNVHIKNGLYTELRFEISL